jgi:DNA-binding response OmpR family regulator
MMRAANLLIVDDIQSNRETLENLTAALGHTPILAANGVTALKIIVQQPIDLVLLDVMMPDMDGYEVLSQIKDNPTWRDIPVIMISALDEINSVVNCIKMGADDYLTKPFNATLLKARIGACLERKFWHDQEQVYLRQIEKYNQTLEIQVQERTQELIKAKEQLEKLNRVKDEVLSSLYYEAQKPFQNLLKALKQRFTDGLQEVNHLFDSLKQSLLVTQIDPATHIYPFELTSIRNILATAIAASRDFARSRQVSLGEIPACGGQTIGQEELYTLISADFIATEIDDEGAAYSLAIKRSQKTDNHSKRLCAEALIELLKVAVKFANPNSIIELSCEPLEKEIELSINTTGRHIAEDILPHFFHSPSDLVTPGRHPGLGSSIAYHLIESLGGTVTVANRDKEGISLTIRLKRKQL